MISTVDVNAAILVVALFTKDNSDYVLSYHVNLDLDRIVKTKIKIFLSKTTLSPFGNNQAMPTIQFHMSLYIDGNTTLPFIRIFCNILWVSC